MLLFAEQESRISHLDFNVVNETADGESYNEQTY